MARDVQLGGDRVELELSDESERFEVVLAYRLDGELYELAAMEPPLLATLERRPPDRTDTERLLDVQ